MYTYKVRGKHACPLRRLLCSLAHIFHSRLCCFTWKEKRTIFQYTHRKTKQVQYSSLAIVEKDSTLIEGRKTHRPISTPRSIGCPRRLLSRLDYNCMGKGTTKGTKKTDSALECGLHIRGKVERNTCKLACPLHRLLCSLAHMFHGGLGCIA